MTLVQYLLMKILNCSKILILMVFKYNLLHMHCFLCTLLLFSVLCVFWLVSYKLSIMATSLFSA